jgi:hypothetical protein
MRVARELSQSQLRELALIGARERLEQLRDEQARLRNVFPELFRPGRRPAAQSNSNAAAAPARRRRRRPKMSAAQRKAVSERMRKYWADRRKKSAQK